MNEPLANKFGLNSDKLDLVLVRLINDPIANTKICLCNILYYTNTKLVTIRNIVD